MNAASAFFFFDIPIAIPTQNKMLKFPIIGDNIPLKNFPVTQIAPPSFTNVVLVKTAVNAINIPTMGKNKTGPIIALANFCILFKILSFI